MPPSRESDTIAAVATPPGRGGVGIVRVSGPACVELAHAVCGALPAPRIAYLTDFRDGVGEAMDRGIALFFPSPASFTGEDVLELHAHGSPVVLDLILRRLYQIGARAARPGEFSERAFLNGKLDLPQAEAIADLIESASAQAALCAQRTLHGDFSRRIEHLRDDLIDFRVYVEAAIDFPEEEIDFLAAPEVLQRLEAVRAALANTLTSTYQGVLLREGMNVVIAGRPNVGKSSLLNALAGRDSAIVADVPGTTRDLLREQIQVDGMPIHVIDTAGLRSTGDRVERMGIDRAWDAIATADAILLLVDDRAGLASEDRDILARLPAGPETLIVHNKIDLSGHAPGLAGGPGAEALYLSALTGEGLELLREHLKGIMGFSGGEGVFMARGRHLDALRKAEQALASAHDHLTKEPAGELLAEDLRLALEQIGGITGEFLSDDLLGRIFSSFCIGK